jgi:hypothetical protein
MPSSCMLRRVALVRTEVSEERIASIIRVTRINELGTTLAVVSNRSAPRETLCVSRIVHRFLSNANVVLRSQILITLIVPQKVGSYKIQTA